MQLETVGEIVRVLRSRRNLEQVELARGCGWRDASAVSRIETDRIKPTRRTLVKLADALADPAVTGPSSVIRSWLYYAAGLLPTAEEVSGLRLDLPPVGAWSQPAVVVDFAWTVWQVNEPFRALIGLPHDPLGRNLLEMFFEPGGPVRARIGGNWERSATSTLRQFRAENDRRQGDRWFKVLLGRLEKLPDFSRLWRETTAEGPGQISQRYAKETSIGTVALLRLPLTADPRLSVMQVVPEDARAARVLWDANLV